MIRSFLINKYITKEFLKIVFNISLFFFCLGFIINLFEEINLFKDYDVGIQIPIILSLLFVPSLIYNMFPFVILLSGIWFFLKIKKTDEIIALKVSGMSNFSIILVPSILSVILGIFFITLMNPVTAVLVKKYETIKSIYYEKEKDYLAAVTENGIWIKEKLNGKNYIIKSSHLKNENLMNLTIYEFDNDNNRSPFERDRSRVIHSSSFRKLKHKTQVFIESESDYYRTRLTHSLEVSQISRSICRLLRLNEDLGETVALAHDLGHPPFGHNGEKALNIAMQDHGGFNHNDQTLRVLTHIEKRHPDFSGLNLTWESLEGIVKHNGIVVNNIPFHTNIYNNKHDLLLSKQPFMESQIAAISDDVAYNNHDVEDAIRGGLLSIDQLQENIFFHKKYNDIPQKQ